MMITSAEGTKIHLWGIIQSNWGIVRKGEFLSPFEGNADQALAEISRMARTLIPASWPDAPLLFVGLENQTLQLGLKERRLPQFLSVGIFICNRAIQDQTKEGSVLYLAWNQEKLTPQLSPENLAAIEKVNWSNHARDFSW
jgi:hypothetical protein